MSRLPLDNLRQMLCRVILLLDIGIISTIDTFIAVVTTIEGNKWSFLKLIQTWAMLPVSASKGGIEGKKLEIN